MTSRMALSAAAILGVSMAAGADSPRPEDKGGEPKHALTSNDVDRRLAELEQHAAALLKEVQALRAESKALAAKNVRADEVRIFALKHADAAGMAKMLKQLLQGPDAKTLSIAADDRTNSVVVRGGSEQLEVIEAIISRLEEKGAKGEKGDEKRKTRDVEKKAGSDLDGLKSRFQDLDIDVQKLQERAEWLKRMGQKGLMSASQIELDMKSLEKARDEIQKARDQLLKQFEKAGTPEKEEKKPEKK
jgi:type II secretory pathway component GspD/PulD (secretin)